jgi:hypothetical protein
VTIVPTCSISDDEINDTVANLDGGDYEMFNVASEAQRQLAVAGRAVHAFVGPPCMTGLIVNSGLSTVQNIPIVSYFSVAYQVETRLNTTFATLSSVSTMNSQQGKAGMRLLNHIKVLKSTLILYLHSHRPGRRTVYI